MQYAKHPNEILIKNNIFKPSDINLDTIAKSLGAKVTYMPLVNCEGSISPPSDTTKKYHIRVNNSDKNNKQRIRFSLAHELGHLVNDLPKIFNCTFHDMHKYKIEGNKDIDIEVRANKFAAELIMPEAMFLKVLNNKDITVNTVVTLANEFNVSISSAVQRLIALTDKACMYIFYWQNTRERWYFGRSSILSDDVCTIKKPFPVPEEYNVSFEVKADKWVRSENYKDNSVIESTLVIQDYAYLTLIWWKDIDV